MIDHVLEDALRCERVVADDLASFWIGCGGDRAPSPLAFAVAGGARADRLGYAFAAGYEAALWCLLPGRDRARLAALCATEKGGAHPRAITTRWANAALDGEKTFVTLAGHAQDLLVLATVGTEGDRSRLVMLSVAADAPGVTLRRHPDAPFVPEIPHGSVRFDAVRAVELLPGDGWTDYVRPFRTIEDIHVHAAVLAYLARTGIAYGWPRPLIARACALITAFAALAAGDPSAAATHLGLGGAIELARALVLELDVLFERAPEAERARWRRDRPLLEVASKARALRLEKAWASL